MNSLFATVMDATSSVDWPAGRYAGRLYSAPDPAEFSLGTNGFEHQQSPEKERRKERATKYKCCDTLRDDPPDERLSGEPEYKIAVGADHETDDPTCTFLGSVGLSAIPALESVSAHVVQSFQRLPCLLHHAARLAPAWKRHYPDRVSQIGMLQGKASLPGVNLKNWAYGILTHCKELIQQLHELGAFSIVDEQISFDVDFTNVSQPAVLAAFLCLACVYSQRQRT